MKCAPAEELGDFPELALLPQENARRKAAAAAEIFPDDLILGADTMIISGGKAIETGRLLFSIIATYFGNYIELRIFQLIFTADVLQYGRYGLRVKYIRR